jgi:voltage-gated potassium channel
MIYRLLYNVRRWSTGRSSLASAEDIKRQFYHLLLLFVCLFVLHTVSIMIFEKKNLIDSIWLTMTTATTVGYGDISAATLWGRISTIVFMYIGGIFVLAQTAGLYFEVRGEKRRRIVNGDWRWHMKDHLIFLNVPKNNSEMYMHGVIESLRETERFRDSEILIVTSQYDDGLPHHLQKLGAVHYNGRPDNPELLAQAHPELAKAIVVMCENEQDIVSDSVSFNILCRLKDLKVENQIVVECINDTNRNRMRDVGADTVIRPLRAYPEMMARALESPGLEVIVEEIFQSQGLNDCRRFDCCFKKTWNDVVKAILGSDIGLPLAYVDADSNEVVVSPKGSSEVNAKSLFVLVYDPAVLQTTDVTALL